MVTVCFVENRLKLEFKGRRKETSQETSTVSEVRDDDSLGHSGESGGGEKWSNSNYVLKDLLMDWIRGVREKVESGMTPYPRKLWEWKGQHRWDREHERKKSKARLFRFQPRDPEIADSIHRDGTQEKEGVNFRNKMLTFLWNRIFHFQNKCCSFSKF